MADFMLTPSWQQECERFKQLMPRTVEAVKASTNDPILLDIGGVRFRTTLATLRRDENSLLAQMFSITGFQLDREPDGSYFMDRDGTHFRYILNYMRGCFNHDGLPRSTIVALANEAEFYQLRGFHEMLCPSATRSPIKKVGTHRLGDGIIYQLGGGAAWVNPATTGKVIVSGSLNNMINMIGRAPDKSTGSSHNALNKYIVLDLKSGRLRPTHMSLAYNGFGLSGANWSLFGSLGEGSEGTAKWMHLTSDRLLSEDCNPQLFPITENGNYFFQLFKLVCVGPDQLGGSCYSFHVGQLEFYGELNTPDL